jgi:hypothetical protein
LLNAALGPSSIESAKDVNREPLTVNRQVQKQRPTLRLVHRPTLAYGKLGPSTVLKTTDMRLEYQADLLLEGQQDMRVTKHTDMRATYGYAPKAVKYLNTGIDSGVWGLVKTK